MAAVVLLLAVGAAFGFIYTRPVGARVTAIPADATIRGCSTEASGTLEAGELEPGSYEVSITRAGFEPITTEIDIGRFSDNEFVFELEPLPQRIAIEAHPEAAVCRIIEDGGEIAAGEGSLETSALAGDIRIEVSLAGHNTYTRDLFLDSETALEVWLDPEGQLVSCLGILQSAGAPKGVAFTPDGSEMWTTILDGPPSIEVYDTSSLRLIDTITLGDHGAVEIVFTGDGGTAYASQMETALVYEIDTATRQVERTLDTESAWSKVVELSPDETTLYVANWSGDDVSIIDLSTGLLRDRIRTADTPRGLWATEDGASLYVAGFGGGELERIDLATGAVSELFDSDGALRHIVGDSERGVLFISDMARDCIWQHDVATGTTTKFVDTDEKPNTIDLSPDGTILYVSCRGENNAVSYYIPGPEWGTILLFDARTGEPLDAIVGGNQCTALDVSTDGAMLVFSDFLDARMRLYEVPPYDTLAAGAGGRWQAHYQDLIK